MHTKSTLQYYLTMTLRKPPTQEGVLIPPFRLQVSNAFMLVC